MKRFARAPMRGLLPLFLVLGLIRPAHSPAGELGEGGVQAVEDEGPPKDAILELKNFERILERVRKRTEELKDEIESVVKREYGRLKEEITVKYKRELEGIEKAERRRRDDAIERFEKFLEEYPETTYSPMAMFRLAELYYEKEQDNFILAMDEFKELEEKFDRGEVKEPPREPVKNFYRSIDLYEKILTSYPNFEYLDGTLYMAGICYLENSELEVPARRIEKFPWFAAYLKGKKEMEEERKRREEEELSTIPVKGRKGVEGEEEEEKEETLERDEVALVYFKNLVERFTESRLVPEAYWRIAEYYFSGTTVEDLEKAIEIYHDILAKGFENLIDKTLYKLAWTYYRINRYQDAISNFIKLIDLQNERFSGREIRMGEFDLREEAKEYIAISFTEWEDKGGIDNAILYMQDIGGREYGFEILKRIADIYNIQERWNLSVDAYKKVVSLYPDSPEAPSMYEKIVRGYYSLNDVESATREKAALARMFGKESRWAKIHKNDREVINKAKSLIQNSMRDSGIYYHKLAQKTRERDDYLTAAQYYMDYLNQFPYAPDAFEINFNYAECLFYSGKYQEAIIQYRKVLKYPEKEYFVHAAEGILYAYENLINEREGGFSPPPSAGAVEGEIIPLPISPLKKEFIETCDKFPEWVSGSDKIPAFLYKAAEIFFTHRHYKEARERFMKIIETYPGNDVAAHAAGLFVDTYTNEKDWANVKKYSALFSSMKLGGTTTVKEEKAVTLKIVEAGAHFKIGENLENAGKYLEAAQVYLEYTHLYPDSPHRELALYNAATNFQNAKKIDESISTHEKFVSEYPDSKHLKNVLFRLAINYENLLDFPRAIDKYLQIHHRFPAEPQAADALYNASFLQEGLGEYEKAAGNFIRYATLYPEKGDAEQLYYLGALSFDRAKDLDNALVHFRKYIDLYPFANPDRVLEAGCRIARIYEKKNRPKDMLKAYGEVDRRYRGFVREGNTALSDTGIKYIAEARFNLIEEDFKKYLTLVFKGSQAQMLSQFKKKDSARSELEKAYMEIIKLGNFEWASAAIHHIGLLYEDFSRCVFESPVPKGLNEEEASLYKAELEDQFGFPLENKAVGFFKSNIEKALHFKENNRWIEESRKKLVTLRRSEYQPEKEFPLLLSLSTLEKSLPFIMEAEEDRPGGGQGEGGETTPTSPGPEKGEGEGVKGQD